MRSIAVVGGGISGLAAALRLRDVAQDRGLDLKIALYEAADRAGGCIQTWHERSSVLEAGADSILADKPWGMQLLRRLNLDGQLIDIRPEYKGARIVHRGKLRALPPHFRLFAPASVVALAGSGLFSPMGIARAAIEPLIPARTTADDESLASFVQRRFGSEILTNLAQPLLAGIYSADPERLSMQATLPTFLELERRYGSVMRGMRASSSGIPRPKLMSLRGGLSALVDGIERELTDVEHVREQVTSLRRLRAHHDAAIFAIPAYATAEIVREEDPALANLLDRIRYNSIATINLVYNRDEIPEMPRAQGFIVPFAEGRRIVAATIVSQKYPDRSPPDAMVFRVFVGGALQPELVRENDECLVQIARSELGDLLGIRAQPVFTRVSRAIRMLPEYGVGHTALVSEIEARTAALGGLALAGSAYHGVGIPDCIHSGEVAADRLLGMI